MADRAEPKPASLPLPGGRDGATVRVHPLYCGEGRWPDAWPHRREGALAKLHALGFREPRSDWVPFPFVAYLVEHPTAGPFLIDTGIHASVADDPRENLGGLLSMGAAKPTAFEPKDAVPAQLDERGLTAADVGLVVMTHLHYDHTSGASQLAHATFVVNEREWQAARRPGSLLRGYARPHFDHPYDWRTVDFDGPGVDSHSTFGRALDLFGDGSVRLLATPGHTPGHMSVLMRTGSREVLAVGDAAYTRRALRTGQLPAFTDDDHLFRRSLREIQLYARQTPEALLIPGHDMVAWRELQPVYG
ncbi:MAG: N-acyl homoserine lactonase family protein [Actinobacteria bacterium]|nr:N-acyl homoserine lactonase family protein [Actinomycetota bacterium]